MLRKISLKILVHSLFWLFYIVVLFVLDPQCFGDFSLSWFNSIEVGLLLLVSGIAYLNDQVLLPHFFKKKDYWQYTLLTFTLLLLSTLFYCTCIIDCSNTLGYCMADDIWIIALPYVFFTLIWVVLELFQKQVEFDKLEGEKAALQLKFLKAQINPHVLFNSLNTIYEKAEKENESIADLILMLSENLKYVLNDSQDTLVDLENDIAFIENYLEFQKLRTEGINTILYEKEVDSYEHTIAPLILIDFIENAFKYSVYKEGQSSIIDIKLTIAKGKLKFTCKNEYTPDHESNNQAATQIGLQNIRQRLQLIYKDKFELNISKQGGYFTAELTIELK